jgi:acetyltransferase-like isoleucine patch superfamily enzyme
MFKRGMLTVIALMPFAFLRHALYRLLLGYRISRGSHVGFGTILDCEECLISGGTIGACNVIHANLFEMECGSQIGKLNSIRNCHSVHLCEESVIVDRNKIIGTREGISPYKDCENFLLGVKSIITSGHHFDMSDTITIGEEVTIGGVGCQIWTHGFDPNRIKIQAPVTIGDKVYVGSRTLMVQGVTICSNVSIAAGTVVSKSITQPGFYVSSQIMRKGDAPDYSQNEKIVEFENARFVRK